MVHSIKNPPVISFNKYQRTCPKHTFEIGEFGKYCYCSLTGKTCNKANCPQEESEDDETCEN